MNFKLFKYLLLVLTYNNHDHKKIWIKLITYPQYTPLYYSICPYQYPHGRLPLGPRHYIRLNKRSPHTTATTSKYNH